MHEFMTNCLYLLVICLSVMGCTAVILILIGMIKGIINMVKDAMKDNSHDEETD